MEMKLRSLCTAFVMLGITAGLLDCARGQGAANPGTPEVGQRALDFELPIVNGEGYLSLSEAYKDGPVVVIFLRGYPGYQCPICSQQVSSLINRANALQQAAHRVILVYPGPGEGLSRNAEQFLGSRRLPPPLVLVRDDDMQVVQQWGLRWDKHRETAYPSTFVLDRYGRIAWRKVSRSHGERSTIDEILKELGKL